VWLQPPCTNIQSAPNCACTSSQRIATTCYRVTSNGSTVAALEVRAETLGDMLREKGWWPLKVEAAG
jgi:hypothetical protein